MLTWSPSPQVRTPFSTGECAPNTFPHSCRFARTRAWQSLNRWLGAFLLNGWLSPNDAASLLACYMGSALGQQGTALNGCPAGQRGVSGKAAPAPSQGQARMHAFTLLHRRMRCLLHPTCLTPSLVQAIWASCRGGSASSRCSQSIWGRRRCCAVSGRRHSQWCEGHLSGWVARLAGGRATGFGGLMHLIVEVGGVATGGGGPYS